MDALVTRNLTILLTDIKGFTDKTSRKSRGEILEMLERHKSVVLPVLEGRGGKLIKTIGDAFLMVFESPTDAVLSGVAVQEALRAHNQDKAEDDRLDVRVAINTGEVNLADNDIFGEPVNITARIEAVAEAGEVFFTEAVYLAMNKKEVPSSEVGLLQLKGIPEKVRVYKVKREEPVRQVSAAHSAFETAGRTLGAAAAAVAAASPAKAASKPVQPAISCKALPSTRRRTLALLIDVCFVGMLVGFFFPRGWVDVKTDDSVPPAAKAAIEKAAEHGTVRFDKTGLHIEDDEDTINIGTGGIDIRERGKSGSREVLRVEKGGAVRVKDPKAVASLQARYGDVRAEKRRRRDRRSFAWPLVWFAYCLLFLKKLGTTPGGKIMKLSVERVDGRPLEKRDRFYRAAASVLSGYCVGLGFLWGLWEKDGRGWHDLLAGTRVVALD